MNRRLDDIAVPQNSSHKFLKRDDAPIADGSRIFPRQVKNAHYCCVLPEKVKSPILVAISKPCLESLNISHEEADAPEFIQVFSGNRQLPGMDEPYTTVYGTHSAGQWFGQMGDGRAIYLGETHISQPEFPEDGNYYTLQLRELQLKGSGRSPFSRGFDGRAVLRSSVREFLVSEAMYHLRVPTTRALTLIATNQGIRRPWYAATSQSNPYPASGGGVNGKFPPDTMVIEPGAIVCRVSRSFLRFGHLEIFGHRQELQELVQMADYICLREYPHLLGGDLPTNSLPDSIPPGSPRRYIELFRAITSRVAYLMSQWLRVGYIQGNMNSDNTLVGGRTIDYGPFGWMETFDPQYQPFTSDAYGNFTFIRQPTAMQVNLRTLASSAFEPLLKYVAKSHDVDVHPFIDELHKIVEEEYLQKFTEHYTEVQREKLGLSMFVGSSDDELWSSLMRVMSNAPCDFTIFFRELASVDTNMAPKEAYGVIARSLSSPMMGNDEKNAITTEWEAWLERYLQRLQGNCFSTEERRQVMNRTNPKYVLRNWMGTLAYEEAEEGRFELVEELQRVLSDPYSEQTEAVAARWYQPTPQWARQLPGVSFFSCSS